MSRKSRTTVLPEQSVSPLVAFDKSHMLCVRSADGHRFLVDRNCAMVSGVLRRMMRRKSCDGDTATATTTTATTITTVTTPSPTPSEVIRIGCESYELLQLDEIRSDLLELALQAMHFKYRYDGDPERRPLEPQHTAETRHKLAALSVLLDM
ncbi:hypothetical protein DQ04_01671080 [Trypanosoma grayi]|uniref:hypothetical protein n=1 Tax=Trypanosoma grayi TaxID=71804 RepID=UPI0004F496DC|nr:hypothetical protein DQ04_01671080 [Trypanosoma grayi]KEG12491.1 hypothetical protein DQ04_01671080 [Trypanosoma grayi]